MADRRDPLGKRALFWAPGNETEGPVGTEPSWASGKRALYSPPPVESSSRRRGRAPLRAEATVAAAMAEGAEPAPRRSRPARTEVGDSALELFGAVVVDCGSCGARRRVDLVRYARLHLPAFFVRPGRGYTHFMTCPACKRRTWVSASWKLPGR